MSHSLALTAIQLPFVGENEPLTRVTITDLFVFLQLSNGCFIQRWTGGRGYTLKMDDRCADWLIHGVVTKAVGSRLDHLFVAVAVTNHLELWALRTTYRREN